MVLQGSEERRPVLALLGWLVVLATALGAADGLLLGLRQPPLAPAVGLGQVAFTLAVLDGLIGLLLALAVAPLLLALQRVPGLVRQLPELIFIALGLAGAAGFGYLLIRQPDWRGFDLRLAGLATLLVGGLVLLRAGWSVPERVRLLPGATLLVGLALVLLTGIVLGTLRPWSPAVHLALDQSLSGAQLLPPLRHLADRDGDGAPTFLCSEDCDCDDRDPALHPGALDSAGDGRDLDCDGADGPRLLPPPPPAPAAPVAPSPEEPGGGVDGEDTAADDSADAPAAPGLPLPAAPSAPHVVLVPPVAPPALGVPSSAAPSLAPAGMRPPPTTPVTPGAGVPTPGTPPVAPPPPATPVAPAVPGGMPPTPPPPPAAPAPAVAPGPGPTPAAVVAPPAASAAVSAPPNVVPAAPLFPLAAPAAAVAPPPATAPATEPPPPAARTEAQPVPSQGQVW